ncbi:hypothetical protein [Streptomyces sp. NPDC048644]|uniref:hypothetical protein n=1 Tax=Streptomyces sp. NPDC048644 TaxID=3365582 RepID=UPI00371C502C
MSDCDGLCRDCTCAFPPARGGHHLSKAAEKRAWQQDVLFELLELGELYGVHANGLRDVR